MGTLLQYIDRSSFQDLENRTILSIIKINNIASRSLSTAVITCRKTCSVTVKSTGLEVEMFCHKLQNWFLLITGMHYFFASLLA